MSPISYFKKAYMAHFYSYRLTRKLIYIQKRAAKATLVLLFYTNHYASGFDEVHERYAVCYNRILYTCVLLIVFLP